MKKIKLLEVKLSLLQGIIDSISATRSRDMDTVARFERKLDAFIEHLKLTAVFHYPGRGHWKFKKKREIRNVKGK